MLGGVFGTIGGINLGVIPDVAFRTVGRVDLGEFFGVLLGELLGVLIGDVFGVLIGDVSGVLLGELFIFSGNGTGAATAAGNTGITADT